MNSKVSITTLVDNTARGRGVRAEHGLSYWIEHEGRCILFDTGQTDLLLHNAAHLRLDLQRVESVVLSHGHYDHTGGLKDVLERAEHPRLFAHPAAFAGKFQQLSNGTFADIGIPAACFAAVRNRVGLPARMDGLAAVGGRLYTTGYIPRRHAFENSGGRFFLDGQGVEPDPLWDDQAIFFETREGAVVLLGCAHAGVVNTIEYVAELTGRPIFGIIGGMHLGAASDARLDATVESIRRHDVQLIAPGHCTGIRAVARLWSEFPGRCTECAVGSAFHFD